MSDRMVRMSYALLVEIGFRAAAWLTAENMYGSGAWEEPGERLPS